MADKARPCPCTNPELPQFKWMSTPYLIAGRGKRLLLYATLFYFCCDVNSPPLSHDSVLKALHTDEGFLTGEECSECGSKGPNWYTLAAIVVATKTTEDVLQALDVVRQQLPAGGYTVKEFARLLQGKPTLQLSLRNKEYTDTKVFGVCSDMVSCQGRIPSNPASHHLTWSALIGRTIDPKFSSHS